MKYLSRYDYKIDTNPVFEIFFRIGVPFYYYFGDRNISFTLFRAIEFCENELVEIQSRL